MSLRLVAVADGFELWSMAATRRAEDFFALGDEAAAAIASALAGTDVPEPRHHDVPSAALDLYLRGRHLLLHGWVGASQDACGLLERAHAAAPDDELIAACYGRALVRSYAYGHREAAKLAEKVLERLPNNPEAQLGLAALHFQRAEAVAGARLLMRCLEDAPGNAEAVEWKGRLLLEVGPVEEGIAALREAYELEPLLGAVLSEIARGLVLLGDWPAAVDVLLGASVDADQAPTFWMYALRYATWVGDRARADQFAARFTDLGTPESRITRMCAGFHDVLRLGSAVNLDVALATQNRAPRSQASFSQYRAEAFALTGDVDAALAALAAADGNGLIDESWIDRCPALERIRGASAFGPIAARIRDRAAAVREVLSER